MEVDGAKTESARSTRVDALDELGSALEVKKMVRGLVREIYQKGH